MRMLVSLGAAASLIVLGLLVSSGARHVTAASQQTVEAAQPNMARSTVTGTIAYIHANDNSTIDFHLIQPDASNDHIIATLPISSALFVPELAWRPDGNELTFSSNHEGAVSFWDSDLYAIRPDGSGLRRITNGPDVSALAAYPKGAVTVNVQVFGSAGPFLVYVDGAPSAQAVTTCCGGSQRLTFNNVAVFSGRFQRAVAIFGFYRWFTPGVGAVLQAGQTVDAGTLVVSGDGAFELGAANLSWRSDNSALAYRFSECCYYKISAHPPEEGDGALLAQPSGFALLIDYAPVAAKANQFLYTNADVLYGNQILLGTEGITDSQVLTSTGVLYQAFHDVKWLPDGSGFLYSKDGLDNDGVLVINSNIYEYDFASQTTTPITNFTSEYAIRLSISPDGQQIVFEHSANGQAIDGLWMVNRDGSNPHVFVQGPDIGRPAWSRVTPPALKKVYLPLIVR